MSRGVCVRNAERASGGPQVGFLCPSTQMCRLPVPLMHGRVALCVACVVSSLSSDVRPKRVVVEGLVDPRPV